MNHFLLASVIAFGATASALAQQYDLRAPHTLEGHQILKHEFHVTKSQSALHRAPQQAVSVTDSIQFTSFGMSFYDGGAFSYEGGKFAKYKTSIVWYEDGTVRIDNLFNLQLHNNCGDEELSLWGTYDDATQRISIPTPDDNMTLCAKLYGQLNGYLLAGQADQNINFYPADCLELQVSDDRLSVQTLQNALILEEYDGTLSTHTCIKYVKMYQACEGKKLVVFSEDQIEFAKPLYPGTTQSKNLYIANVGKTALDYNLAIESEGEKQFTVKPTSGSLRSMIMKEIKLTYAPQQTGSHNATLNISADGQSFQYPVSGQCIEYPDYSGIVDEGEIEIHTSAEYPFELEYTFLDLCAHSTVGYNVGDSWLEAIVEVPAGQLGTLTWTGYTYNDYFFGTKATVTVDDKKVLGCQVNCKKSYR